MRKVIKEKKFRHKGKGYVVKAEIDDIGIHVRAYIGDHRANRFTYSITCDTDSDLKLLLGLSGIDHLMEACAKDIKAGII